MWTDLGVTINGETLLLDTSGAAFWPARSTLIFADLHLEKGSSYARGRQFLPPYDTLATLSRMRAAVLRYNPGRIIALGDSFHDGRAAERLSPEARDMLSAFACEFIWISGNHDPMPPAWLGGTVTAEWSEGGLLFRHEPQEICRPGEIAGHLHPCAHVAKWGRRVRRRCFAADGVRMVLPSFGSYTGGLDVGEEAIARLFGPRFHAYMLGTERVYAMPRIQVGRRNTTDDIQPISSAITTAARP
ncbi:MAG TPA: ligase-associated DNA damage response endonuclease PdeM [Rhizomicrobium sp.]|jgi:DNA ligase-associated metallophosphoesterase|nr:ligase-associated DNA damage response endonuclease PdeM [Rhizomicrobium sp.]